MDGTLDCMLGGRRGYLLKADGRGVESCRTALQFFVRSNIRTDVSYLRNGADGKAGGDLHPKIRGG